MRPNVLVRMQPAELAQQLGEDRADLRRAGVGPSSAVEEPTLPVLVESSEPLVPDAAADAVAHTARGHGPPLSLSSPDYTDPTPNDGCSRPAIYVCGCSAAALSGSLPHLTRRC